MEGDLNNGMKNFRTEVEAVKQVEGGLGGYLAVDGQQAVAAQKVVAAAPTVVVAEKAQNNEIGNKSSKEEIEQYKTRWKLWSWLYFFRNNFGMGLMFGLIQLYTVWVRNKMNGDATYRAY
uniref:Uncharacterized protein n=1 Tax=Ditylenchus dipsaci TaxID=166011 RepID=A0A915CUI8_9BILA